jgi:RPA family protein
MSQSKTPSSSSGRPDRKTAKRVFAREFDDATEIFQESDEDRAPKFALLPTGERANRLFVVGALIEVENIGKKSDFYRGRVVGPTGTFFIYAGQYQPDAMEMLQDIDTPEFVSVVGKPRTWERDDDENSDEESGLMTQLTLESITVVDQATRDRWVVETADQTMARIDEFQTGSDNPVADQAHETYGSELGAYKQGAKRGLVDVAGVEFESEDDESDE